MEIRVGEQVGVGRRSRACTRGENVADGKLKQGYVGAGSTVRTDDYVSVRSV